MKTVGFGHFDSTQATPLGILQGLGTYVPIFPHPPQSPSASTTRNPNLMVFKPTNASDQDQLIHRNIFDLLSKIISEIPRPINV